jgi:hypothetical protein
MIYRSETAEAPAAEAKAEEVKEEKVGPRHLVNSVS